MIRHIVALRFRWNVAGDQLRQTDIAVQSGPGEFAPRPDMALQLALGAGVFVFFALMFAIGAMGGGDVKLIGAIALWFPWIEMARITIIMSLVGAALTLVVLAEHRMRKRPGQPEVPYGVAIAFAALWPVGERFFNHFA